ncbi:MAG: tetraacyldisaccharide 4'-kinase [Candidatus Omnitrophica bacterium]|nr:tetraacyldisaccharide 4'-kinase [Candidatus Omnitrophota bacterium]
MPSSKEYLYKLVTGKIKGPLAAFLRGFLFMLSLIYDLVVVILAFVYRIKPFRLNARVISVGNITLGGTGKTTLVEYLCAKLSSSGKRIAILTRGYKRDASGEGLAGMGDEPAMLQKELPQVHVLVDKDRVRAGIKAIKEHGADTLLLDDGMQQWRIFKDLEIVTIDAACPFGNYRLLPAGFLREPLSALRRADIFLLTRIAPEQDTEGLYARLRGINPRALIVESRHEPVSFTNTHNPDEVLNLSSFRGKHAAVFSGIGNPQGFEDCLCSLGINIGMPIRFSDHHDYTQNELDGIAGEAVKNKLEVIITTRKDAVKIARLENAGLPVFALDIKLNIIKNEAEFNRRLLSLYSL